MAAVKGMWVDADLLILTDVVQVDEENFREKIREAVELHQGRETIDRSIGGDLVIGGDREREEEPEDRPNDRRDVVSHEMAIDAGDPAPDGPAVLIAEAAFSPKGSIALHSCGSDAVCGDAVGLEAQWLLGLIAEEERRRRDQEDEPSSYLLAERSGRGCVICGDCEAPTVDESCAGCRGQMEPVVDFADYARPMRWM